MPSERPCGTGGPTFSASSRAQTSFEGRGQGFQHAFIVSFASQGDRNYYVGEPWITDPAFYDPMHHAFKSFVTALLSDQEGSVVVFDFSLKQTSDPHTAATGSKIPDDEYLPGRS
ncbi:Dabb family protein [Arthrobacter burdickii]|uniref:Dabb family protein n=1 Tax=Arthrobacter burdickii TaxID=3035920 RepID=A0ABT8JYF0_9MICC|nr:Dabb family protein [Arthrobacter burdickii]MDN4609877.1 Dabb family protein [Arthrobacter burdickii]